MAETVAAATRVSLRDYIGGERRAAASGEMYEQRNPMRPDEVVAEVPACDAGAAVAAAHEAFPGWAAAPAPQRGNLLVKVADCTATRRIYVQDGVYDGGARTVRRDQVVRLGPARAGPRGAGVLHGARHHLRGCMSDERWLVTGALGCIGAWIARTLVDEDAAVVGFDLGNDDSRLRLIMEPDELARVTLLGGDVTDSAQLGRALDEHEVTHVVHLAALLVPLARADPPRGALVNVVGTTNVFEVVKARRERIRGLAYASSAAVYDVADSAAALAAEDAVGHPVTLYGVHKLANEGTARVYWLEDRVPSVGLRPYVVYGPGRDTGIEGVRETIELFRRRSA